MSEKLLKSEKEAWMLAMLAVGIVVGVLLGQFILAVTMQPVLNKLPDPSFYNNTQQTTTPIVNPGDPTYRNVTHFAFHSTGDNNDGMGFTGLYNPSANIWYVRFHTVSIKEIGLRAGQVIIRYVVESFGSDVYTDETILTFAKSEIKPDLSFTISITEAIKDDIDFATAVIELVGEN